MKVRKLKSKQILLLYLLKSKTYEQVIKKNVSSASVKSNLIELLINLKKSLRIIFNYHVKNKMILFVGLPENLSSKINKSTTHLSLSKHFNVQGRLYDVSKNVILEKNTKFLGLSNKRCKPDLIVLIDHINMDALVKESYSTKIPLICVNNNYNKKSSLYQNIYSVSLSPDSLQQLSNVFFVGLSFLFK